MEAILIYCLKASGILILFHTAYELLLKKETFFHVNRAFLLLGLLVAMIHPLFIITNYVQMDALGSDVYTYSQTSGDLNNSSGSQAIGILELIQVLFVFGIVVMGARFVIQLLSIRKLIYKHPLVKGDGYTLVEMNSGLAPFSFFNYIFYSRDQYPEEELEAILEHEKAHCRQWHSLDVMVAQIVLILLWANPLSWFYLKNVKQNLEFLADSKASDQIGSRKTYQYTMLKISGNLKVIPVTNNFYSSLIKKRIVMLHRSKSKNRNILKTLIIIPVLALFLWSFNSRTIYIPPASDNEVAVGAREADQMIEIKLNKDTSNKELEDLKKELSEKGVDFSYTVVHNNSKEIIDLDISFSSTEGKNSFMGSSRFNNYGEPIDPVTLVFDKDNNIFYTSGEDERVKFLKSEKNKSTRVHPDDDVHQSIEIYNDNGKEEIRVNGKKVSRKELEKMEKKGELHNQHIMVRKKVQADKETRIMIMSDSDVDQDVEVISDDEPGFFFLNGDVNDDWLILLDGEEVDTDAIRDLGKDDVETINVIRGEKAAEKYGKKAKDGVLEITTKD